MKFAVIADIHGNSAALDAVIRDIRNLGVSDIVNLGDHFSGPLDAAGTAKLLQAQDILSIRGNHDRAISEMAPHDMGQSDQAAHEQLGPDAIAWLRKLPATAMFTDDVFLCHGTPTSDTTYWLERVNTDGSVRPARENEVEAEIAHIRASLILCGHTHIPRLVQSASGQTILNPGSVGCPAYDDDHPVYHEMQTGTPNAAYAVVEQTAHGWSATFRSIPYNWAPMADLAEKAGRPEWARAIATGWIRTYSAPS